MSEHEKTNGCGGPPQTRRRKVCLVTTEFHGLFRNGGIGTANTALAVTLAENGFDVTVAVANSDESGPRLAIGNFADLRASWAKRGITLDYVRPHPCISGCFDETRMASYCVFLYVQAGGFDVVLFNDNGGHGFYSLLAKHSGIFLDPPLMYVVAHGPLDWVHELNALEFYSLNPVLTAYMERRCAALADLLISPSRYLLDWMVERKWVPPGHGLVVQNLLGLDEMPAHGPDLGTRRPVKELVFFGRQEIRKGITLFCDALDLLDQTTDLSAVVVTFLGKFSRIGAMHTGVYVAERARRWRTQLRVLAVYDQGEAVRYLQRPGVLAVIPSRTENSPCVVAECLQLGLLFLATNTGGTPELIEPQDRESCLFPPNPAALAQRLRELLSTGHGPAHLDVLPAQTRARWISLVAGSPTHSAEPASAHPQALVSVCLVWGSPYFKACLDSVRQQAYAPIEIIVIASRVDSAQSDLKSVAADGIKVHFDAYDSPAAARNAAATLASGEYLLFVDESITTLLPQAVAILLSAAQRTRADMVTGFPEPQVGLDLAKTSAHDLDLPVGACEEVGAVENCFGEGVLLVSAAWFATSGGFAADCARHLLHWSFLAAAVLARAALEVVPAAIMRLREDSGRLEDGERTVEDHRKILRLYENAPIRTISRVTETTLRVNRKNLRKLEQALQGISAGAREYATRLASLDPNCTEAFRTFISYCLERRMVDLAIDFAMSNDVSLLPETLLASTRANQTAALDLIRFRTLDLGHTIDLTAELGWRSEPFHGLGVDELKRISGRALQQPVPVGYAIVKITGACPPGTNAVHIAAVTDASGPLRISAVLCQPWSRPALSRTGLVSNGSAWWSDWRDMAEPDVRSQLTIRLPEPLKELLDLYLITEREDTAQLTPITVSWTEVKADLSLTGKVTPSAIELATETAPLPFEYLKRAELVTDTSDVNFTVYVPDDHTLIHPVPGRPTMVRLRAALAAGACGLRCIVSVEHEKAHPIEFGVWARPPGVPMTTTDALATTDNFSGWLRVDTPFVRTSFSLQLAAPTTERMDLYLATRVVETDNVDFCHSFWHDFMVVSAPIRRPEPAAVTSAEPPPPTEPPPPAAIPAPVAKPRSTGPAISSAADEKLRGSYLICGAARTGTNLLAAGLRLTKLAGWPMEYFNIPSMNAVNILRRLGLPPDTVDAPDFAPRLDHIMQAGTVHGIFSATIHWWDLQNLLAAVAKRQGKAPPFKDHVAEELRAFMPGLRAFLPELRFVWVRRENKVAQAISHYIAKMTGEWSKLRLHPGPSPTHSADVPYDYSAISELVYSAELEDSGWREVLPTSPETTLPLAYEEISADYAEAVTRVMDFIGVPLAKDAVPGPRFVRQANSRSLEWEARFRSEARKAVAPVEAAASAVQLS